MTILTIVQDAAIRAGITPIPTSAVGNIDPNAVLLVAFARDAGRDAIERASWVQLDLAATITGDGVTTLFTLPADWDRFSPGDNSPNGSLVSSKYPLTPLYGPVNTEELNLLKALPASTVRPMWRIIGGSIEIWPALAVAELVTFNYYSSYWIVSGNGVRKRDWTMDTDSSLIEEDVIMKGSLWRWLMNRGLDYAEQFRAFEMSFSRNAAQQMTDRVISTSTTAPRGTGNDFFGTVSYTLP